MQNKIIAFGEVVWDILPNEKLLGGTPANLVFRCNSFNEEGHLLSRVGNDELGENALERLKQLGISDENVQIDTEFPTGTVHITFDDNNEPKYNVALDVAFDHIEFSAEALKLVRNANCLFFGLLPQRFGISKNTLRELIKESPGSLHFFDLKLFDHFFNVNVVETLLNSAHIVRVKEREISFLSAQLKFDSTTIESFCAQLANKYKVEIVLVTRGNNGVFAFHEKQGSFYERGYAIDVEDNVGSGMAFSAGFLHFHLNGKGIQEAIGFGNAAGALNTTKRGATTFFNKNDVLGFMESNVKNR